MTHIKDQIAAVRKRLREQTRGSRSKSLRHDGRTNADIASSKYRERADQGHITDPDKKEFTEEDVNAFAKDLQEDKNYPDTVASEIANGVLRRNRKVEFITKRMDGYAFFDVEHHQGGLTAIVFNTNHVLYDKLIASLEPDIGEETDSQLLDRINEASDTLHLLFAAWARYHLEDVVDREVLYDVRQKWGQMARFMLTERPAD